MIEEEMPTNGENSDLDVPSEESKNSSGNIESDHSQRMNGDVKVSPDKEELFKKQARFEKEERERSIEESKSKDEKKRVSAFLKWGIVIFILIGLFFLYWWLVL